MQNFTCRIDEDLYKELTEIADEKDRSLIGIVREALWTYVHGEQAKKEVSTFENALMWVDIRLRNDYHTGMHADAIQSMVDDLRPLIRLLMRERKNNSTIIRCGEDWGVGTECFLEKDHYENHQGFSSAGYLCEWKTNSDGIEEAGMR